MQRQPPTGRISAAEVEPRAAGATSFLPCQTGKRSRRRREDGSTHRITVENRFTLWSPLAPAPLVLLALPSPSPCTAAKHGGSWTSSRSSRESNSAVLYNSDLSTGLVGPLWQAASAACACRSGSTCTASGCELAGVSSRQALRGGTAFDGSGLHVQHGGGIPGAPIWRA